MYIEKSAIQSKQPWKILHRKKKLDMNLLVGQFIRCSFDKKNNNYYRGKDCIEELCKKIKESANEIINHEKKEIIPLTNEENNIYNK